MGRVKKLCAVVYLIAACAALGSFGLSLFGPFTGRFATALDEPSYRIFMAACLVVCALQLLYTLIRVATDRPEPACIRPQGCADVEVTLAALESVARTAADDDDLLVEDVTVRIQGRDASRVRVEIEAIALTEAALDELAARVSDRVRAAIETLVGPAAASVRVRYLPSKTTTVTREVSHE